MIWWISMLLHFSSCIWIHDKAIRQRGTRWRSDMFESRGAAGPQITIITNEHTHTHTHTHTEICSTPHCGAHTHGSVHHSEPAGTVKCLLTQPQDRSWIINKCIIWLVLLHTHTLTLSHTHTHTHTQRNVTLYSVDSTELPTNMVKSSYGIWSHQ